MKSVLHLLGLHRKDQYKPNHVSMHQNAVLFSAAVGQSSLPFTVNKLLRMFTDIESDKKNRENIRVTHVLWISKQ